MLAMTHCDAAKLSKQHGKNSQYALCASQWHKTLTYKDDFFKDGMTYDADFKKLFDYAHNNKSHNVKIQRMCLKKILKLKIRLKKLSKKEIKRQIMVNIHYILVVVLLYY